MSETIGVRSINAIFRPGLIKRDALMFKRIGVLGIEKLCDVGINVQDDPFSEPRWLMEKGIIFDPEEEFPHIIQSPHFVDSEARRGYEAFFTMYSDNRNKLKSHIEQWLSQGTKDEEVPKVQLLTYVTGEVLLRPLSAYYRGAKHLDARPIYINKLYESSRQPAVATEDVINIAINQLPVPDDSTSWEQIMDFRNDPDSESKFLALRNWINKTARAKLTPLEIEQELEGLLQEYRDHMQLHRMKTNASTLETIIVTGAEIAENLVKLQIGKLAKGLFSLRHRKLALLEGELKLPGREIAFISKAQETFR